MIIDIVCSALGDHQSGRQNVPGYDGRHDGCVNDAQALQSAHALFGVGHQLTRRFGSRSRVRVAHPTR